jgi:hypothetical protein
MSELVLPVFWRTKVISEPVPFVLLRIMGIIYIYIYICLRACSFDFLNHGYISEPALLDYLRGLGAHHPNWSY